ncbi:MAG TPA: glucosyl transferase, partial [Ignavibacteriaceae bacterium]|nr:glucosyl transferase [Ignavibacteriaceae bacterium]
NRADCGIRSILTGSINKLWGSSSNDLYAVGNNGNIAHYNGQSWSKIESGTDLNINDIWGISDGNGGFNKYLAAYNAMLKLDANKNLSRIEAESGMHIFSIWGYTNQLIYVVGGENDALYKNYKWEIINDPLVNTLYRIKGQNYNDVFGISSLGTILHFNGYNWGSINVPVENIFLELNVKGNVIASVGWRGEEAAITIIRRNQG